jgi:hypothetical protein
MRTDIDETALLNRAFAAYFRSNGNSASIPSNFSSVRRHGGRFYVVLENITGILGVYRVRNDGILKGLKRWPKAIEVVSTIRD